MKGTVLYDSATGHTGRMADVIVKGLMKGGVEAMSFPIGQVDEGWARESKVLIVGGPVYAASASARLRTFLERDFARLEPAGKLGGAFSTADYVHGGGDLLLQQVLVHMIAKGMMAYSGGSSFGRPVIHLGPVAISDALESYDAVFHLYGERMASKALDLFS